MVGRSFTCASVAALASPELRPPVGSVLLALARRRLLRVAGREAVEDGFAFRHRILHGVTYRGVPKRRRAVLHVRVAERLAEAGPGTSAEDEAIGHHLGQAYQYLAQLAGDRLPPPAALAPPVRPPSGLSRGRDLARGPPGRRGSVGRSTPSARKASMGAEIDARDLVQAAAAGDPHGWDGLVERFGALVWSTARAYGLSSDEGADAAQTTWLRLAEQLGHLQDRHDRIGVWLASTARQESLRLLGARVADHADPGREQPVGPVAATATGLEREVMLWRVVRDLPEHCRRLLRVLSAVPPPDQEELAAALDLAVADVPTARAACLEEFRHRLASIGIKADAADS